MPCADGEIAARDRVVGELLREALVCGIALGHHEEARGVLVDPVHDPRPRLAANAVLIGTLGRIESVADGAADKGSVTLPVEGAVFALPLAGEIDVEQEKARLEKSAAKAAKEVGGLKGKLSNEKFLANAPDEVVEEQRERLVAAEAEQAKLEAALSRLAEMG